jgi:hypothetical protein
VNIRVFRGVEDVGVATIDRPRLSADVRPAASHNFAIAISTTGYAWCGPFSRYDDAPAMNADRTEKLLVDAAVFMLWSMHGA